jgi:putative ABC transport system permease protein
VTTFQLDLVEGRDYSRDFVSDAETAFLVNEAMVKLMGLKTAAGAKLSQGDHSRTIIGVVKDFNFHTLNKGIEPLVLRLDPTTANNVYIRISPGPVSSTLDFIRETWERIAPDYPFAYRFVDEEFAEGYRSLERAGSLLKRFAILAVFISCLGLFGLVSFTAEQRTKEVGIRKVLGSSVAEIMVLLTREYTIRILWASLISCPLAYWLMNRWLKSFVFRTEIGWGVFIVAVAGTFTIAMLTVSFQAIKAARANPVDALHYE